MFQRISQLHARMVQRIIAVTGCGLFLMIIPNCKSRCMFIRKIKPFGPLMCANLGDTYDGSAVQTYNKIHLSCHLRIKWNQNTTDQDKVCKLKDFKNCCELTDNRGSGYFRTIKSHSKKSIRVNASCGTMPSEIFNKKTNFLSTDVSSNDTNQEDRIVSVAVSRINYFLVYMLLSSNQNNGSNCAVSMFDTRTKNEVDCYYFFCKGGAEKGHIFTGSCITSCTEQCMYILFVGKMVVIRTFKESGDGNINLTRVSDEKIESDHDGSVSCFIYENCTLICVWGGKFYQVNPGGSSELIARWSVDVKDMSDIAINPLFSDLVIVTSSGFFHFGINDYNKTLEQKRFVEGDFKTALWMNNSIWAQSKDYSSPFSTYNV